MLHAHVHGGVSLNLNFTTVKPAGVRYYRHAPKNEMTNERAKKQGGGRERGSATSDPETSPFSAGTQFHSDALPGTTPTPTPHGPTGDWVDLAVGAVPVGNAEPQPARVGAAAAVWGSLVDFPAAMGEATRSK